MPVIGSIDTANRRIQLDAGVRSYHPVEDLYHEIRALRRTDESLRGFAVPVTAAGHVSKGGGKFTARYAVLHGGWRVVPEDTSHTLAVTGEQLTEEGGSGGACLDLTTLSAASKVVVEYQPAEAEIIEVSTGGGADWSAGERATILAAMALLDATISSRAVAGDAMALTQDEREAVAWQTLEEPLSAHSGTIGSLGHEVGHVHDALIVRHGTVSAGSTAAVIESSITGPDGLYNGLTIMVRGSGERCARVIKYFDGATGTFTVILPFAFVPQDGDSIFVLTQRHIAIRGVVR